MLSTNSRLRTLDLVSTGIGEDGLALIIDALVANATHSALQRIFLGALGIERVSFVSGAD